MTVKELHTFLVNTMKDLNVVFTINNVKYTDGHIYTDKDNLYIELELL